MAKAERAKFENPIMPAVHAPMRTLVIAMSIMCYLATLSIGGLLLINRAVTTWTSDIAQEVSVQVLPREGADIQADVQRSAALLESSPGVLAIEVFSHADAKAMLEPWIGQSRILDELPVPQIIGVTVNPVDPPDFTALSDRLAKEVPNAQLDTHRHWQNELTATARALHALGLIVLIVIGLSAVALVVYAARTALEANRHVIEVLYLVGAPDKFIARRVENRFLIAGLRAGIIGAVSGFASFAVIALSGQLGYPSGLADACQRLLGWDGDKVVMIKTYASFLMIPVLATLIALMTTRIAALRILRTMT